MCVCVCVRVRFPPQRPDHRLHFKNAFGAIIRAGIGLVRLSELALEAFGAIIRAGIGSRELVHQFRCPPIHTVEFEGFVKSQLALTQLTLGTLCGAVTSNLDLFSSPNENFEAHCAGLEIK